jgi:DNA-binding FadR family transcriptional regulator
VESDELKRLLEQAQLLEKIADHLAEFYKVVDAIKQNERERCAKAVTATHGTSAGERIRSLKKTRKD